MLWSRDSDPLGFRVEEVRYRLNILVFLRSFLIILRWALRCALAYFFWALRCFPAALRSERVPELRVFAWAGAAKLTLNITRRISREIFFIGLLPGHFWLK